MSKHVVTSADGTVTEFDAKTGAVIEPSETTEEAVETPEESETPEPEPKEEEREETKEGEEEGAEDKEDKPEESDEEKSDKDLSRGARKRIAKLARDKAAARQQVEFLQAELAKARQAPRDDQPAPKPQAQGEPVEPKEDDYETPGEYSKALLKYVKDLTAWQVKQERAEAEESARTTKAKTEYQAQVDTYKQRADEFKKSNPDFQDVLDSCEINPSPALQALFLQLKNGPQLFYELSKNEQEFARLNALPPQLASYELGILEQLITKPKPTLKKTTTKIPAPINPLSGKGSASVGKMTLAQAAESGDFAAYERLRNEQLKK